MEFGTREILIVFGIIVIFVILLDGFRRVRRSHNGSLKVKRRSKQAIFDDDGLGDLSTEVGEVRIKTRDEESVERVSDNMRGLRIDRRTSAYLQNCDHNG